MSLFYLIEKHYRIWLASYLFGKLSALFVAYISGRSSYESRYTIFLHKLTHIHTYYGIFIAKHSLSKSLYKQSLTYSRRSEEYKRAYRSIRVFEPHRVASDGFHYRIYSPILPYYFTCKLFAHTHKTLVVRLFETFDRYATHHRHSRSHIVYGYMYSVFLFFLAKLTLKTIYLFGNLYYTVSNFSCLFEILIPCCIVFICFEQQYFLFEILYILRSFHIFDPYTCPYFVESIYGFVGEVSIVNIPTCQFHTSLQYLVAIYYLMVVFVSVFDIFQNSDSLLLRGRFYYNLLKTTLQRTVFFYTLAVLFQSSSSDTLQFASRKSRLQYISGIERPRRTAGSYDSMYLVYK